MAKTGSYHIHVIVEFPYFSHKIAVSEWIVTSKVVRRLMLNDSGDNLVITNTEPKQKSSMSSRYTTCFSALPLFPKI